MSIVSARATRPSHWTAARVSVVWRNFDLQLMVYAALLLAFGLAMAFSNTAAAGTGILDGSSVFLRALMWTAIAVAVALLATVIVYHWV
jgi:cell division protein FtsW (lipid II flippase)